MNRKFFSKLLVIILLLIIVINNISYAVNITKEDFKKINVPTLIVNGGSKDIVPISEAEYISGNIKKSEMLILEDEGHFSYMINCKWYNKLRDFLEK